MAQRQKRQQGRGRKNRKHGRWLRKPSYKRYLAEKRWLRNKAKQIRRYMRRHPDWKWSAFPNLSDEIKALCLPQKKNPS